jgi:hypothetical protein
VDHADGLIEIECPIYFLWRDFNNNNNNNNNNVSLVDYIYINQRFFFI